jgi:hypothetical protein
VQSFFQVLMIFLIMYLMHWCFFVNIHMILISFKFVFYFEKRNFFSNFFLWIEIHQKSLIRISSYTSWFMARTSRKIYRRSTCNLGWCVDITELLCINDFLSYEMSNVNLSEVFESDTIFFSIFTFVVLTYNYEINIYRCEDFIGKTTDSLTDTSVYYKLC